MQRDNQGPGSPALSSPPGASQLPPLSPPPDLAAVYSYTATRNSHRTSGQRRLPPNAAPDWLIPDSAHCPAPPLLREGPAPSPREPPSSPARSRISPGREGPSRSSRGLSLGPVPAIQIRKLRLIRREKQLVFGLTARYGARRESRIPVSHPSALTLWPFRPSRSSCL